MFPSFLKTSKSKKKLPNLVSSIIDWMNPVHPMFALLLQTSVQDLQRYLLAYCDPSLNANLYRPSEGLLSVTRKPVKCETVLSDLLIEVVRIYRLHFLICKTSTRQTL